MKARSEFQLKMVYMLNKFATFKAISLIGKYVSVSTLNILGVLQIRVCGWGEDRCHKPTGRLKKNPV